MNITNTRHIFIRIHEHRTFTSPRVVSRQVPVAVSAGVASAADHVLLTDAASSHQAVSRVSAALTFTVMFRASWVAVTCYNGK